MTGDPLPEKRLVLLELLKVAWVYVHLDPRREGVVLPEFLREQPRLVLQYGYNMPVPMHDLTIDEKGISATLSFRRSPHATFIPWSAVFAMTDGEKHGMVWPSDVPADLELEAQSKPEAPPPAPAPATKPGKKPRPSHLKLVD
ncbi:MAG: hypothetical protein JNJ46_26945 [Myxococcales bacterium]|jgi:hypothetical protein|nr:hypothetical protein [Myxococcales bacterium]